MEFPNNHDEMIKHLIDETAHPPEWWEILAQLDDGDSVEPPHFTEDDLIEAWKQCYGDATMPQQPERGGEARSTAHAKAGSTRVMADAKVSVPERNHATQLSNKK